MKEIYRDFFLICIYRMLKVLKSKNIEVEERNIALGTWTVQQLQEAVPGARTVPQIFVDDKYVGGFSELKEMLDG